MYYKSVNRGLSFTTPGVYALALVFVAGLIAVNTGLNALFLFLSSGLSLILISGLLSESAIKNYEVSGYLQQTTETGKPFDLLLVVHNKHRFAPIYGFENHAIRDIPKSIILPLKPKGSYGTGNVMSLPPRVSKTITVRMDPMKRGLYLNIKFLLRTNFPFGLIDKFKITNASGFLSVMPRIVPELYEQLKHDYRKRVAQQDDEREFFCHKPHTIQESSRHVDWKKSAGKPARQWVLKEYRSEVAEFGIMLTTQWSHLRKAETEETYERLISVLRTASEVIKEASREVVLQLDDGTYAVGYDAICHFLAALPDHASRDNPWDRLDSKAEVKGVFLQLELGLTGYEWRNYISHDARLLAGRKR